MDPLPMLGEIASDHLKATVEQLVANKHACDALARRHSSIAALAGEAFGFWPDSYHIPGPFSFFTKVFPLSSYDDRERGVPALVPALRTIGDAHARHPEEMPPDEKDATLAFLQHQDRTVWGNDECATYTWIKPLGLFLAGEGKNRVSLFQRNGIEWIPACVNSVDYPSADRIVLYTTEEAQLKQCWAVLDGRWVELVASPAWVVPVLHAYGVTERKRWPAALPPLAAIRRAYAEISEQRPDSKPCIDLHVVQARDTWESEQILVSPFSRMPARKRLRWIAAIASTALIGLVLLSIGHTWLTYVAIAMLASALVGFTVSESKFIPMQRKDVEPERSYLAWQRTTTDAVRNAYLP